MDKGREPNEFDGGTSDAVPLGFVLASAGELAGSGFRDALAPLGVNPRHFAVLWALSAFGQHTQQQLSERLRIPASRVVALIDDLEGRAAVRRLTNTTDRRIRMVELTDAGRELFAELWQSASEFQASLLGDLTDDEQRALRGLLARVSANIGHGEASLRLRAW